MGITRQQALDCFASDDLIGIGMEADAVRRNHHPDGIVSYTIDYALEHPEDETSLAAELRRMTRLGATSIRIPGNRQQYTSLEGYESLFSRIKRNLPDVQLHGLSATQMHSLARAAQLSLRDTLMRLRDAGLDAIDSDAIILDDAIRAHIAPEKCTAANWIEAHRTAHKIGLATTATMVFGFGETMIQRVDHLELLRDLQAETGGFTSFTPLVYQGDTSFATEPTAVEYLKTLAVSRLYLDAIDNLQSSWTTQGLKVLQIALRFGANDVDAVFLQDHFGKPGGATEEELRRIIREAGFRPVERDALYRRMSFR
jgi:cyclic dehypoxanthinyl futalosine synthase